MAERVRGTERERERMTERVSEREIERKRERAKPFVRLLLFVFLSTKCSR